MASPTVGFTDVQHPTSGITGHPEGHFQESHSDKVIPTSLGEVSWVPAHRRSPQMGAMFHALDMQQVFSDWCQWLKTALCLHASWNVKLCLLLFQFLSSSEYSKRAQQSSAEWIKNVYLRANHNSHHRLELCFGRADYVPCKIQWLNCLANVK